ncbi:MAG TPA: hypothetical protein VN285_06040 [Candidatus Deferrimicrobium sp.]|nr:hypothetical protein [Candidatus Deferrimicrobium sp.]
MKIYVGNLASRTAEQDVLHAFEKFGQVQHVNIAKSSLDQSSRGFGFVDMAIDNEGKAAIADLNGASLHGQTLRVSQAQQRAKAS